MLHASALAVGWKSALLALFHSRDLSTAANVDAENDIPKLCLEGDDEIEAFHLDDTEIAVRLVKVPGFHDYRTPPHANLLFPSRPIL
ncbi:MAG: hypothetical protein ABJE10_01620 [bacterium]